MHPNEIIDTFAADRPEGDRIALRTLLEPLADAGGDDQLERARELITDSATADAFVQVSLAAQDRRRRAVALDLLRLENRRAAVLGLAAAGVDERRCLLDVASGLIEPAEREAFGVLVASPHLHFLALDPSYDTGTVKPLSVALHQHQHHPDAMTGIANLVESYTAKERTGVLRTLATGAFLSNSRASKMFWALWADQRGDLVALCSAVSVNTAGGAAVVLQRSDAGTIIRQMAHQAHNKTVDELFLLDTFKRHQDEVAQQRFWDLWQAEPQFKNLFPLPGNVNYASLADLFRRPDYKAAILQFADPLRHQPDRDLLFWVASAPELARNPVLMERFKGLWEDEATRPTLLSICGDAANGGVVADSPGRRGLINLLALPDFADLMPEFVSIQTSRDVKSGALHILASDEVGSDPDLVRWVCRGLGRSDSLVAVLASRLMPADLHGSEMLDGVSRVVAGHGRRELKEVSPGYGHGGVVGPSRPPTTVDSDERTDWTWLCMILNSWSELQEDAPWISAAVNLAGVIEKPQIKELVLCALGRERPLAAEQILNSLAGIDNLAAQFQVVKAMAVAQETRMLADRIPDFQVTAHGRPEQQRTPTSALLLAARTALMAVAEAGDELITDLTRQAPQEDLLARAAALLATADQLNLGDGGEFLCEVVLQTGVDARANQRQSAARRLLTPTAGSHDVMVRHEQEFTDAANAFGTTVRNLLRSALRRNDQQTSKQITDTIGRIEDPEDQSRIVQALVIAEEARTIGKNRDETRADVQVLRQAPGSPRSLAARVAMNGIIHAGDRLATELSMGGSGALDQANAILTAAYGTGRRDPAESVFCTIRESGRVPAASAVVRQQFHHVQRIVNLTPTVTSPTRAMSREAPLAEQNDLSGERLSVS